jgi:hypothetical protein
MMIHRAIDELGANALEAFSILSCDRVLIVGLLLEEPNGRRGRTQYPG